MPKLVCQEHAEKKCSNCQLAFDKSVMSRANRHMRRTFGIGPCTGRVPGSKLNIELKEPVVATHCETCNFDFRTRAGLAKHEKEGCAGLAECTSCTTCFATGMGQGMDHWQCQPCTHTTKPDNVTFTQSNLKFVAGATNQVHFEAETNSETKEELAERAKQ